MLAEVFWPPEARLWLCEHQTGRRIPVLRPEGDFYYNLATFVPANPATAKKSPPIGRRRGTGPEKK
jgi:hypothetical protein